MARKEAVIDELELAQNELRVADYKLRQAEYAYKVALREVEAIKQQRRLAKQGGES